MTFKIKSLKIIYLHRLIANMSNLFQEVLTNAEGVQQRLLGPTYQYYNQIKTPSQMGISSTGSLSALNTDINGLIQYVQVLSSGTGGATTKGNILGNKYFMKTGAKCLEPGGQEVDRYIYINNVPNGNIPYISSSLGATFSKFQGLIPGTMSSANTLNPFLLAQAFLSGSTPACQKVTLETIDSSNNVSTETQYVTLIDLQNMDPCSMPNNINTYTNPQKMCKQNFENMTLDAEPLQFPKDPIVQVYFAGLAALGIYVLTRLLKNK
jgi:hypothetical protein